MKTELRRTLAASGLTLAVFLTGCDMAGSQSERTGLSRSARPEDFASRRVDGADLSSVQPIADRVFRSYFRVNAAASSAANLVAYPTDVSERAGADRGEEVATEGTGGPPPRGTVGDFLGVSPRRYRRTAELRLEPVGTAVLARVRVMFQRLTTTERAAFARERGDDRPSETAIDRMGPASPAPREEWRDDRRDRRTEQEILNAIQAGLTTTQPADE